MAFVKRRKNESFSHFMMRSKRANWRDGTTRDIQRYHVDYYHRGPRKARQLKSKNARKRNRAIKRRNRRRNRIRKARMADRI